eukprot:19370-Chlamydomonas_euryale.AAC.8
MPERCMTRQKNARVVACRGFTLGDRFVLALQTRRPFVFGLYDALRDRLSTARQDRASIGGFTASRVQAMTEGSQPGWPVCPPSTNMALACRKGHTQLMSATGMLLSYTTFGSCYCRLIKTTRRLMGIAEMCPLLYTTIVEAAWSEEHERLFVLRKPYNAKP